MNLDEMINSMTPEVYQRLSTAVELGKWPDGVALTPEQKEQAVVIRQAMLQARDEFQAGADASKVKEHAAAMIEGVPGTRIDYLEIVDAETMQPLAENRKPALMAAAVYFGDVRLIDNIEL